MDVWMANDALHASTFQQVEDFEVKAGKPYHLASLLWPDV